MTFLSCGERVKLSSDRFVHFGRENQAKYSFTISTLENMFQSERPFRHDV